MSVGTLCRRPCFEFLPPKTAAGRDRLLSVQADLSTLVPDVYSVIYGAVGNRETITGVATDIQEAGENVAPHLGFGGQAESELGLLVDLDKRAIMKQLVALRGDLRSGMGRTSQLNHADELVSFEREYRGDHFHIDVAAYPETHPEAP